MTNITTIKDTRVKIPASKELLNLLEKHSEKITELPENLAKVLRENGHKFPTAKIEIISEGKEIKAPKLNMKLLREVLKETEFKEETKQGTKESTKDKTKSNNRPALDSKSNTKTQGYLYLTDLKWLQRFLDQLRETDSNSEDFYLHNLIDLSQLTLPENDIIERNPILEARCQRLREEQSNWEYRKMTKNVDAVLKNYPEDTIAYQLKALNSQVIAVLQFVFSVVAGFVFGFLGIELIVGNLDFGFRLLLGIMIALIVALAEIYFLAKKLNEYDDTALKSNYPGVSTTPSKKKAHAD